MYSFEELIAKLRKKKSVRYEDLIVASVFKVTRVATSWKTLRQQYRKDPAAWYQLERRMFNMVPEKYHARIKRPTSGTRELLKRTRREIRKQKRAIKSAPFTGQGIGRIDVEDDTASKLAEARERAKVIRDKKNKELKKLNAVQNKKAKAIAIVKALVMIAIVQGRKRKLAPLASALVSKSPAPYRISRATEHKLEHLSSRSGMKERVEEMKAREAEPKGPVTKTQREELAFWEKRIRSKMTHSLKVGQKVRRSRKWWPGNKATYYGVILSLEIGSTNNGRPRPAYKVQWNRSNLGPSTFLEEELEVVKR